MITATDLHKRAQERGDQPETLADIITRCRFAAELKQRQAASKREQSHKFYAMRQDERYTLVQREDAVYAAANLMGEAFALEDTARFADSVADALIRVTG